MMKLLLINSVSIISVLLAGYLCANGINGWGWFILLSFCTFLYPKSLKKEGDK